MKIHKKIMKNISKDKKIEFVHIVCDFVTKKINCKEFSQLSSQFCDGYKKMYNEMTTKNDRDNKIVFEIIYEHLKLTEDERGYIIKTIDQNLLDEFKILLLKQFNNHISDLEFVMQSELFSKEVERLQNVYMSKIKLMPE